MKTKNNDILLHIIFIVLVLCVMMPVLLVVAISLTSESSIIQNGYKFIPDKLNFSAYEFIIKDGEAVFTAYKNTFITVIFGTIIKVFMTAMYGYSISRKDFPFRGFFSMLVLITILFSGGLAPQYQIYVKMLNLKNTYTVLILAGLGLGFDAFMMKSYFASNIPFEIIESGKVDGASESRIFFKLVLPMAVPILATISLMTAIGYWNAIQPSLLFIERESLYTLQYTMQKALMNVSYVKQMIEQGVVGMDSSLEDMPTESARMAMAIFGVGPIILAYPFFQRFFISGLTVGAVKG